MLLSRNGLTCILMGLAVPMLLKAFYNLPCLPKVEVCKCTEAWLITRLELGIFEHFHPVEPPLVVILLPNLGGQIPSTDAATQSPSAMHIAWLGLKPTCHAET